MARSAASTCRRRATWAQLLRHEDGSLSSSSLLDRALSASECAAQLSRVSETRVLASTCAIAILRGSRSIAMAQCCSTLLCGVLRRARGDQGGSARASVD
ncbi:hypothetical protein FA09DRAFT_173053 [Tilletiopsis washingtonensis]|uniref:Uncharacterized protein n=1 Tax=Tilletiopsis washingtonensis TaxID=58919 RepID=A0A316YZW0_9BASI|nr:hypothetical protein FA09DRAFT_173053 [Tilletiopsis washingtonensis]PWN94682.1 hypothetical protein FA09DRAFT_173053 [Tilletiopsis washingtonensis]